MHKAKKTLGGVLMGAKSVRGTIERILFDDEQTSSTRIVCVDIRTHKGVVEVDVVRNARYHKRFDAFWKQSEAIGFKNMKGLPVAVSGLDGTCTKSLLLLKAEKAG